MKAAQWMGSKMIRIGEVPKSTTTAPKDAIGDEQVHAEIFLGHEAFGYIEEVGRGVSNFKAGDGVIILAVIACGKCFYCQRQQYSLCDKTNPAEEMDGLYGHRLSVCFGYSRLTGGYPGNQAEYCRVPNADLVLLNCPEDMPAKKALRLADVTNTAWHRVELAEVGPSEVVGI
ncbi:hypothetical protein MBLNU13_g11331t2 [Cladosporium sp. NU13]